ncbi:uncharacterized protein LOC136066332 [Quercus suber]|uniref:uncharacterized protein LOC136066332 n=1 Tax=Quercus suber TaxID=58331 RepID=UPI0032DF28B1
MKEIALCGLIARALSDHRTSFFEGRGSHHTNRDKSKVSSYAQTETPPPPESTKSLPSVEQTDMEALVKAISPYYQMSFTTLMKVTPLKPFRFEAMWVTNGRCEAVVYSAWDMGSHKDPISSVLMKVGHCQEQLIMWNKKIFGNVRWNLAKVRKKLENAEACSMGGGGNERLASLNEELQNLMALEECMWSQRAKLDYLQYGDQNTKYFHCRALERNKRNYISSIENDAGVWTEEESQVGDILLRFNSNLFSLANPTHFDSVLSGVEPRVTKAMNSDFVKPFEVSEIHAAIHQMDSNISWT